MELKKGFIKAEDYCKRVFDGTHDSPKPCKNGYKLLTSKNILSGELDKEDAYYISKEDYNVINQRSKVQQFDVLFSMIGSVGNVCLIKDSEIDFAIKNMGVFSCEDENKATFLYYYLQSPIAKKIINSYLNGAVQKFLGLERLRTFPVPEYDDEKGRIAAVLSSFDSKISLNRAINRNLEALAKQLYDYWFVQFDFPDENGKPYKSSGGKMVWNEVLKREVPEGWKVKSIGNVAEVYNGATPSTEDEQNYGGDIVWITPKDLSNQQEKFVYQGERNISQKGYDSCSTHLLPLNTILMSSRAPIGLLAIAKSKLCTNQGFKSFVPKNKSMSTYLYYYLQMHKKQVEQLGTGTTFKEVSRDDIMGFNIIVPENKILEKWEEILLPINNKQLELQKETLSLIRQRDELLPLLMNGQVAIK
jgi:type I restriction enzyme S subunit